MRTTSLTILFLISLGQLFAQELDKKDFLGTWKVVDSQLISEVEINLDEDGKQKMELMRKGFINTRFSFSANKEFKVNFPETIPAFMKELEFINNKKWIIEDGRKITIGTADDGYSLMGIIVMQKENRTFFILDESPFLLEVTKQ